MSSLKPKVLDLYKNLLFMGRDYPLGYEFFRSRCRNVFSRNSKETDPEKIRQMINHGKYIMQELEAMYKLKKYRALKQRYYKEEQDDFSKTQKSSTTGKILVQDIFRFVNVTEKNTDVHFLHNCPFCRSCIKSCAEIS